ncbi:MAG: hypothetical protein ACXV9T_13295 [Methylobacter sp.]
MEELILLAVLVAAFVWVKNKFIAPETAQKIDSFFSYGLTLLKNWLAEVSGKTVNAEKPSDIEKAVARQMPAQQPVVEHKQSQVEIPENSEISVTQNSDTADSCDKTTPEDSVLRRHYLAQIAAEREAITQPYPTDSVLRRHYESMFVLANQPIQITEPEIDTALVIDAPSIKQQIPEDAVLRRHFLAQLQAEVESTFCPPPTDSILKRHYNHFVRESVAERLAEMAL